MNIDNINVYKVNVPFRLTCSHSQKDATSADNIVVEMTISHEALKGYGEGGPRLYVTGETQASAIDAVAELAMCERFPWHLKDVGQIWGFVDSLAGAKNQNSALCAVEMALLDLLAKKEGRNVLHFLPKDHFSNGVRYGGTLPLLAKEMFLKWCKIAKQLSLEAVRLKVGQDLQSNEYALKVAREILGPACDLKVDANMGWDLKLTEAHLPLLKSYGVSIVEQPLWPHDPAWGELAAMAKRNGLELMADESACSIADVEAIIEQGHFDIINVRLSKCGGFHNSLEIIRLIRNAGLNYQIGCQLGETGILSAAGRALSIVSSDALHHDGSYDAFLLKENLTTEDVTFNHGGKATPLKNPGLGITVNHNNLAKYSGHIITVKPPKPANKAYSPNKEATTMTLEKPLDYIAWRKQESEVLESLGGKEVWLLFSGGKDSSLSFYFMSMAAQDFNFSFQIHAGVFPEHRYTKPEMDRIHSFWMERGFRINWHDIHNSDDILEESSDPCLVCQRLRRQLLFDVVGNNCNSLEDLVIVVSYDLSDLASYTLEYLTGGIYSRQVNGRGQSDQKRFAEISQRFYPLFKMDEGYTIYRPILRYNEQDVIRIVKEASIPILTVPCRYANYRPKRTLGAYYDRMDLHFDYDRVFDFAKEHLGLLPMDAYASMNRAHYLQKVF